jgi:ankyrin repeat protein
VTAPQPSAKEPLQLLRSTDEFVWLYHRLTGVEGWSLLSWYAVYGTHDDVMMLIRFGVDLFERELGNERTVLHNAVYYGVEDVYLALFHLFRNKIGIESPDVRGWTLLHLAIASRKETIIRHLLENGADWRAKTLPAVDDIPKSIEGISILSVQITAASGDKRYLEYLDILHDVLDGERKELGQEKEDWFDAIGI